MANLNCAFYASSVGDLCMDVQHQPVPGPPALSMIACCSGSISLCSFAACTASAADRILDCSFANAMSLARLFGGTPGSVVRCPRTCLVNWAGFVLDRDLGMVIKGDPFHEQVRLCCHGSHLFRVGNLERSAQGLADSRHDSLVQVNCQVVPCSRRETNLSNL